MFVSLLSDLPILDKLFIQLYEKKEEKKERKENHQESSND